MRISLIIPSGGVGSRFGASVPKQYILHNGIPIILHTLMKFEEISEIKNCIISADEKWQEFIITNAEKYCPSLQIFFAKSGAERMHSVYNALTDTQISDSDYVLIHDAVRPNVSKKLIQSIIEELKVHWSVIPILPITDTVKKVDSNGFIVETLNRSELFGAQTPQGFKKEVLINSYQEAIKKDFQATDDASIIEFCNHKVFTILGEAKNIKITSKEDLNKI